MWYPEQGTKRASTAHTVAILIRMGQEGSPQVYSGMNITLRLLSLGRAVHNSSRLSVYRLHQPPRGSKSDRQQREWDNILNLQSRQWFETSATSLWRRLTSSFLRRLDTLPKAFFPILYSISTTWSPLLKNIEPLVPLCPRTFCCWCFLCSP